MRWFCQLGPARLCAASGVARPKLGKAGQVNNVKRVLKKAFELDPDLRLVVLDNHDLEAIW
jgi:hypothetical protein